MYVRCEKIWNKCKKYQIKSSQIQMKRKQNKCQNNKIKLNRGECNLISPCDAEEKIASATLFAVQWDQKALSGKAAAIFRQRWS